MADLLKKKYYSNMLAEAVASMASHGAYVLLHHAEYCSYKEPVWMDKTLRSAKRYYKKVNS